ncbi:hypothetical protein RRG08_013346 [Elysia crispata]|uniref:Uncharacterized protein n=1 Tax=Elysia crispata TaxID=231223 RepID=A0AAE1AZA9_9GAST|nr:hypothetical protein RRG08_013346 [Elysia crispata]
MTNCLNYLPSQDGQWLTYLPSQDDQYLNYLPSQDGQWLNYISSQDGHSRQSVDQRADQGELNPSSYLSQQPQRRSGNQPEANPVPQ